MPAERILDADTLKVGKDKLNKAIDSVNNFQKQINTIVVKGDSSVEAAQARISVDGTSHDTLKDRLDTEHQEVTISLEDKASKEELNALGQLKLSGTYATVTELQTAYPAGSDGIFLVTGNGYVYRWNGSAWVQAAQFQSTGISDKAITFQKLSDDINDAINYPATNLILNSGFNNGRTGWTVVGGTDAVTFSTYRATGNGTNILVGGKTQAFVGRGNHVLFVGSRMRVTNSDAYSLSVYATDGESFAYLNDQINLNSKPIMNSWYEVRGLIKLPASFKGKNVSINFVARYLEKEITSEKVTEIFRTIAIDLSGTFGFGYEPTLSESLQFMSKYTGNWFDGSVESLLDIKQYTKSIKTEIETLKGQVESDTNLNDFTTIPYYTDGKLIKVEDLDGSTVVKRLSITYRVDGLINTVIEEVTGKSIVSTMHYDSNGVFTSMTKETIEGGL